MYVRLSIKLLLWSAGLLLAAAAAVTLFLKTLDADFYRRALEQELSSIFDRTVTIGSLSFNVSLVPSLAARDLRIANPPWTSRKDFVTAAIGEARIDLIALWQGRVELRALHLQGVDLLLERNADGKVNWLFRAPDRGTAADLPDFGAVSLADPRIAWRQGDHSNWHVQVNTAEATIRKGAPFELHGLLAYRETAIRLAVKADSSLHAALTGKPWHLSVAVEPKGASVTLDARLRSFKSLEGSDLWFTLKGERLDAWSGIVGQPLPSWGPYALSARTHFAPASLHVTDLQLSLGGLPRQPSRLEISAGEAVLGANVDTLLKVEGKFGDAAFSLQASGAPLTQLQMGGGDAPIALQAAMAQFTLNAKGSIAFMAGIPDFDLALTARGDALAPIRVFASARAHRPFPVDLSMNVAHTREGYKANSIRGRVLGHKLTGDLAYPSGPGAMLSGVLKLERLDLSQSDVKAPDAANAPAATSRAIENVHAASWLDRFDADLSLRIASITGLPLSARKFAAQVQLRKGVIQAKALAITLADTDVSGEGTLRWIKGQPRIDGRAHIAVLDLARSSDGGARRRPGSVLDDPLPLTPLRALEANLQLEIGRVAGAPVTISKIAALARLQGGKLAVDVTSLTAADIPLRGHVFVDASGSAWSVDANAKADRIDLAVLLGALQWPVGANGVIQDLKLVLAAQGTTARGLLKQARVSLRSAPFLLALGRERSLVTVRRASIEAEPGGPLRASALGSALDAPIELVMVGGPLAELLDLESAWPRIEAKLQTVVSEQSLYITATSGPLRQLIGMREVPLKLQATLPGARATMEGTVDNLSVLAVRPLAARIEIANLAHTAALFTQARLPPLPFTAAGSVALGDGEVAIDDLTAQVGKSDAKGRLKIRWRDRPDVSADLTAQLIDTTQWQLDTADPIPALDRRITSLPLLSQDAQLHLRAERIILPAYDLANLAIGGRLANGLVTLSVAAAEGEVHGSLRIDLRRQVPAAALSLSVKEVDAESLSTAASRKGGDGAPLLSMNGQLAASGATLRDMLATGQGEFLFTAGAGTVSIDSGYGLQKFLGKLLHLLVLGRLPKGYAQLECAAAHFIVVDGVATARKGIALRLKHVDILGGGAVQLPTGQILFGYRAVRREFFSFSLLGLTTGIAKVQGTLGNPTTSLDPAGILAHGSAAWATAGLSLLAGDLWLKLGSTANPCVRIAAGAPASNDSLDVLIRSLPLDAHDGDGR